MIVAVRVCTVPAAAGEPGATPRVLVLLVALAGGAGVIAIPRGLFPRVNAAHARHPSWDSHLDALRRAEVHLVYGDDVWPLHETRSAPGRELPWSAVLDAVNAAVPVAR